MFEDRELATTLTLQEDFPKGSRVEAYLVERTSAWGNTQRNVELVPVRTEHVGVTEDKGAELALPVPAHQHIQDGDVLVITFDEQPSQAQIKDAEEKLAVLVRVSRAVAGVVMWPGQQFGTMRSAHVESVLADRD